MRYLGTSLSATFTFWKIHDELERKSGNSISSTTPRIFVQEIIGNGSRAGILIRWRQPELAGRRRRGEPVGAAMPAGGTLVDGKCGDMGGILDLGALVVAAAMAGEDLAAVDDAHMNEVGEHGERASHLAMEHQ